jgi:hypothetical protein
MLDAFRRSVKRRMRHLRIHSDTRDDEAEGVGVLGTKRHVSPTEWAGRDRQAYAETRTVKISSAVADRLMMVMSMGTSPDDVLPRALDALEAV